MSKVRVFTDSISDISEYWVQKYNIKVVPLYIIFGEQSYRDNIDIRVENMYEMVNQLGKLPRTAAPSPTDFIQFFGEAVAEGEDVLYISMSSKLSSTFNNATLASREFPPGRITIVDSLNVSAGLALQVLLASEMADKGASAIKIKERLDKLRSEIQLNILLNDLDYLHKGGRVSNTQHMIGSMLRIRPILYVSHGRILSGTKHRGSTRKIVKKLLSSIFSHLHLIAPEHIIIAHTREKEHAEWMRDMILNETDVSHVHIIEGGCAICSHSGPHSLAISFMLNEIER